MYELFHGGTHFFKELLLWSLTLLNSLILQIFGTDKHLFCLSTTTVLLIASFIINIRIKIEDDL